MDRSQWDHVLGIQFPVPAVTGLGTAHRLQELFTAKQPSPLAEQLLGANTKGECRGQDLPPHDQHCHKSSFFKPCLAWDSAFTHPCRVETWQ